MTDKQLAVLLREYVGSIRREIDVAVEQLPSEAIRIKTFTGNPTEYKYAPALDGLVQIANDLALTAEMLEK